MVSGKTEVDPHFLQGALFSGESNFYVNGEVDKQNCHYWSQENPTGIHQIRKKVQAERWFGVVYGIVTCLDHSFSLILLIQNGI
jgi:hypothetical protein